MTVPRMKIFLHDFASWIGYFHHTYPRLAWYASDRDRAEMQQITGWFMGNTLEHAAHQACPRLPFFALPAEPRKLEAGSPK